MHRPLWIAVFIMGIGYCLEAKSEAPPRFPAQAVWHQNISQAQLHPQSSSMITSLANLGGFGFGRMQIDFAMRIVHAAPGSPTRTIVGFPNANEYYAPDCEPIGTVMPVPANAAIEGSGNLTCDNDNEDCHLLVVQDNVLYEAYRANSSGSSGLQAQCLAVWKLDRVYQTSNRGEHCTSADAAGFPISPLLFNADEVFAATQVSDGDLGHAIRFILPNPRMASDDPLPNTTKRIPLYVRPGSHAGGPSGPPTTIPYGSRLRLRADFPVNLYNPAAQVILRTMQRYGIVLSDGGNIALTAEDDLYNTHKWSALNISSRVFDQSVPGSPVRVQDFSVIDTGNRIVETYDCVRNPEPALIIPKNLEARIGQSQRIGPKLTSLNWQDGTARVDIYRDGVLRVNIDNTGVYSEKPGTNPRPGYIVCNANTTQCSSLVHALPDKYIDPPSPRPQATIIIINDTMHD
ncbi:MAG: hypothetical protein ABI644_10745 [Arenimonas sp.]